MGWQGGDHLSKTVSPDGGGQLDRSQQLRMSRRENLSHGPCSVREEPAAPIPTRVRTPEENRSIDRVWLKAAAKLLGTVEGARASRTDILWRWYIVGIGRKGTAG